MTLEMRMAKALLAHDPQERDMKTKAAACADAARDFFTDMVSGAPVEGRAMHVVAAEEFVVFNRAEWEDFVRRRFLGPPDEQAGIMALRIGPRHQRSL